MVYEFESVSRRSGLSRWRSDAPTVCLGNTFSPPPHDVDFSYGVSTATPVPREPRKPNFAPNIPDRQPKRLTPSSTRYNPPPLHTVRFGHSPEKRSTQRAVAGGQLTLDAELAWVYSSPDYRAARGLCSSPDPAESNGMDADPLGVSELGKLVDRALFSRDSVSAQLTNTSGGREESVTSTFSPAGRQMTHYDFLTKRIKPTTIAEMALARETEFGASSLRPAPPVPPFVLKDAQRLTSEAVLRAREIASERRENTANCRSRSGNEKSRETAASCVDAQRVGSSSSALCASVNGTLARSHTSRGAHASAPSNSRHGGSSLVKDESVGSRPRTALSAQNCNMQVPTVNSPYDGVFDPPRSNLFAQLMHSPIADSVVNNRTVALIRKDMRSLEDGASEKTLKQLDELYRLPSHFITNHPPLLRYAVGGEKEHSLVLRDTSDKKKGGSTITGLVATPCPKEQLAPECSEIPFGLEPRADPYELQRLVYKRDNDLLYARDCRGRVEAENAVYDIKRAVMRAERARLAALASITTLDVEIKEAAERAKIEDEALETLKVDLSHEALQELLHKAQQIREINIKMEEEKAERYAIRVAERTARKELVLTAQNSKFLLEFRRNAIPLIAEEKRMRRTLEIERESWFAQTVADEARQLKEAMIRTVERKENSERRKIEENAKTAFYETFSPGLVDAQKSKALSRQLAREQALHAAAELRNFIAREQEARAHIETEDGDARRKFTLAAIENHTLVERVSEQKNAIFEEDKARHELESAEAAERGAITAKGVMSRQRAEFSDTERYARAEIEQEAFRGKARGEKGGLEDLIRDALEKAAQLRESEERCAKTAARISSDEGCRRKSLEEEEKKDHESIAAAFRANAISAKIAELARSEADERVAVEILQRVSAQQLAKEGTDISDFAFFFAEEREERLHIENEALNQVLPALLAVAQRTIAKAAEELVARKQQQYEDERLDCIGEEEENREMIEHEELESFRALVADEHLSAAVSLLAEKERHAREAVIAAAFSDNLPERLRALERKEREGMAAGEKAKVELRESAAMFAHPFLGMTLAEHILPDGKRIGEVLLEMAAERGGGPGSPAKGGGDNFNELLQEPHLTVDALYVGGPAFREGIALHDQVISINEMRCYSLSQVRDIINDTCTVGKEAIVRCRCLVPIFPDGTPAPGPAASAEHETERSTSAQPPSSQVPHELLSARRRASAAPTSGRLSSSQSYAEWRNISSMGSIGSITDIGGQPPAGSSISENTVAAASLSSIPLPLDYRTVNRTFRVRVMTIDAKYRCLPDIYFDIHAHCQITREIDSRLVVSSIRAFKERERENISRLQSLRDERMKRSIESVRKQLMSSHDQPRSWNRNSTVAQEGTASEKATRCASRQFYVGDDSDAQDYFSFTVKEGSDKSIFSSGASSFAHMRHRTQFSNCPSSPPPTQNTDNPALVPVAMDEATASRFLTAQTSDSAPFVLDAEGNTKTLGLHLAENNGPRSPENEQSLHASLEPIPRLDDSLPLPYHGFSASGIEDSRRADDEIASFSNDTTGSFSLPRDERYSSRDSRSSSRSEVLYDSPHLAARDTERSISEEA